MTEEPQRSLDGVLADLNETLVRLGDTTDLGERAELGERLNRLRAEAAVLRGPALRLLSDEQLDNEIRSTSRALDEIRSQRFDSSMVAGATGHGGGLDPIQTARHNRRVDESGGRAALEARLRACLSEAARRG